MGKDAHDDKNQEQGDVKSTSEGGVGEGVQYTDSGGRNAIGAAGAEPGAGDETGDTGTEPGTGDVIGVAGAELGAVLGTRLDCVSVTNVSQ